MSEILIGDVSYIQEPENNGECFMEFVNEITDDVTGSCMIPMNLPRKEVRNIIKRAKKWFYKNYEYSVRESFLVLPKELFQSEYFKKTRSFTFPKMDETTGGNEVYAVYGVFEAGSRWGSTTYLNSAGGDFSYERALKNNMYEGSHTAAAAENLQYYVIQEKFYDLARQILQNPLSFDYNRLTHQLRFTGETPKKNVICEIYETIPECALFQDEAFFRYCAAKVKISLGQKLNTFDYKLPGNVQVNASEIKDLGEEELENVIEEIKEDEGTDYMMHS